MEHRRDPSGRCPQTWEGRLAVTQLKVLGTPVGTRAFTSEKLRELVAEERQLWNAIPHVKDLQCLAAVAAKRQSEGQPHFAFSPSQPFQRTGARRWYLGNRGGLAPASARWAGRTPVRTRTHHFAHEDGRVGDEIGNKLRCRCLLGIVGGRLAHDRPAQS